MFDHRLDSVSEGFSSLIDSVTAVCCPEGTDCLFFSPCRLCSVPDSNARLAASCSAQHLWVGCPELSVTQQSRGQANEAPPNGAEPGQPSLLVAAVTLKRCLLSPGSDICALTFDLFFSTALCILGVGGGRSKNNFVEAGYFQSRYFCLCLFLSLL